MTAKRSASNDSHLCQFQFADGRKCRMLRHQGHATLCLFHAHDEMQLLESQRLGSEIASSITGAFMTATDINYVLGKLFIALAQRRIPPRHASVLAYISQLMLHSVPGIKKEYPFCYEFDAWKRMEQRASTLSPPPSMRVPAAPAPSVPAAPVPKPGSATAAVTPDPPNAPDATTATPPTAPVPESPVTPKTP
jgi:hypothetical protein